ncbi:hypothetical protein JMM81_22075 [Bacillus sp. V3B]|uniref:YppF family protein n=1 Tax=Bacillus sp. V3B TaxID=2804915 RepID=UPI002108F765|nr:YppF family protein [Bacillus sp. V3B]MCQ6277548.1 hypothetical protein [Bacillus sp. V3B]
MMVQDLINRYKTVKNQNPSHVNELLDYIQKSYIQGELSIVEYKKLFFELDKRKAEKPYAYMIKTTPFEKVDLPG